MTNVSWVTYRRAFYRANAGGANEIEIRVGKRTPALDDFLGREGKRRWAFLTACNPGARRLGAAENRVRTNALKSSLRSGGFLFFEGRAVPTPATGPRKRAFSSSASRGAKRTVSGGGFGQDAFVTGLRGGVARLWPA